MLSSGHYRDGVPDIFDLERLFAQMVVALGLALVAGNGFAMYKHARGQQPEGASGQFRAGRARFLLLVGLVMTVWGVISL